MTLRRLSTRLLISTSLALHAVSAVEAAPPLPTDIAPVAVADPGSTLSPDWKHGPFMEIYVRGYQDSNGDGVGDLRGLISRLDHLQSLGIRGIWLMPVMRSQDADHGYSVSDYRDIEQDYGTLADFDELLKQAHARGIGVIIDYVINHSAADHPLFRHAESSPKSPWRDWYVWEKEKPDGWHIYGNTPWYESDHGWYFAGFYSEMPDFNLKNPKVVDWHHDNLRFWLNRGVDGFRFDAVGNLVEHGPLAWEGQPENHVIMNGVRQLVGRYANRYMVCEAPGDPLAFGQPDSCGCSFAFGHQHKLVGGALGSPAMLEQVASYFETAPATMATFASNHDGFAGARLWDRMRGDDKAYRLVAATYLLQPGTPFLYYGEEIGLAGGKGLSGDHKLRTPMSWTADTQTGGFTTTEPFRALSANVATHNVAAQVGDPNSILSFYKSLIALRNSRPSLQKGRYEAPKSTGWVVSFQRVHEGERTVVVLNYGVQPAATTVAGLPAKQALRPLWPAAGRATRSNAQGQARVKLAPQSFAVYAVDASK